jgi:hypothetical protein
VCSILTTTAATTSAAPSATLAATVLRRNAAPMYILARQTLQQESLQLLWGISIYSLAVVTMSQLSV